MIRRFVSSTVRQLAATAAADLTALELYITSSSVVLTTNVSASTSCRFAAVSAERLLTARTWSSMTTTTANDAADDVLVYLTRWLT